MTPARLAILLVLLLAPAPLHAQDDTGCPADSSLSPWQYVRACILPLFPTDTTDLAHALRDGLHGVKSPESLNSELGELESLTHTRNVFRGLHLRFVHVAEGSDDDDFGDSDDQHIGLHYDWERDLARTPHRQGVAHWGLNLEAAAEGLLVTEPEKNPEPLLEATLFPHLFVSWGGALDVAAIAGHLETVGDSIAKYETIEGFADSEALSGLMAAIWDSLSTQVYLTGGIEGKYETDQALDRDQWAAGIKLGFDVKAWKPSSTLARLNVFDWPAALVRWASGIDGRFRPSGAAIPTLEVALHRVSPGDYDERLALDGLDDYTRLALTLSSRSLLTRVSEGRVWLELQYRHHSEIDPDEAVEAADLHQFDRFIVRIHGPSGLTASWATGRLPLDHDEGDTFGMGFRFKF